MRKHLRTVLVFLIGTLLGFIIHGVIEILVIFLLINKFQNVFMAFSWKTWVLIHHIFTVIIGILGVILASLAYKKLKKL